MSREKHLPHIHDDLDVTRTRLDAFAVATRAEQTTALALLRAQAADESTSAKLGLTSILIATMLVVLAPFLAFDVDDHVRGNPVFAGLAAVVVSVILVIFLVPAMVDVARDQNRRERATVWLGAFQDELARRHLFSGAFR